MKKKQRVKKRLMSDIRFFMHNAKSFAKRTRNIPLRKRIQLGSIEV